jgi:hypothetical protein
MPTRRCDVEADRQGNIHHRGLTLPTAQTYHGATGEPVEVVHVLDTHANTGVAPRSQIELGAVIMGTKGSVTSSTRGLVELMEK